MSAEKSPAGNGANRNNDRYQNTLTERQFVPSAPSDSAFAQLAVDLASGKVLTRQLSPGLAELYWLAWFEGHKSHDAECQARIDRLTWERDLAYYCWTNRKTPADYYAATTSALWEVGA